MAIGAVLVGAGVALLLSGCNCTKEENLEKTVETPSEPVSEVVDD